MPSQVYYSSFTSRARGVAILMNRHCPFQIQSQIKDKGGRFAIIQGFINMEPIIIVNMYGPKHDDPKLLPRHLFEVNVPIIRDHNGKGF